MSDKSKKFADYKFGGIFKNLLKSIDENELAQYLGIQSTSTFRQWTNGYTLPTCENLINLSKYFDVSLDFLLGRTDIPNGDPTDTAIAKRLGLNVEAFTAIEQYNKHIIKRGTLNYILSSGRFRELVELFYDRLIQEFVIVNLRFEDTKQKERLASGDIEAKPENLFLSRGKRQSKYYEAPTIDIDIELAESIYLYKASRLAEDMLKEYVSDKDWTLQELKDGDTDAT